MGETICYINKKCGEIQKYLSASPMLGILEDKLEGLASHSEIHQQWLLDLKRIEDTACHFATVNVFIRLFILENYFTSFVPLGSAFPSFCTSDISSWK